MQEVQCDTQTVTNAKRPAPQDEKEQPSKKIRPAGSESGSTNSSTGAVCGGESLSRESSVAIDLDNLTGRITRSRAGSIV